MAVDTQDPGRGVLSGAFDVLRAIRTSGDATATDIVRETGLPRTTVRRLLNQLESVGAAERIGGRWRIGSTLLQFAASVPGEPGLATVARRTLIDLTRSTGEQSGLTVGSSSGAWVLDLIPAEHRRSQTGVNPGDLETDIAARLGMDASLFASYRAVRRAAAGSDEVAIDTGENRGPLRCVAVPLPLQGGTGAAVWTMLPGARVPASTVEATRRAALSIAAQLPRRSR